MGLVQTLTLRKGSDGVRPDETWVGGEKGNRDSRALVPALSSSP